METRVSARTPVLIVGGGPVGLALAGELGWRGVACTLIEKTDGAIEQPKMDLVGIRTMEFCRRWGIVDWVRDAPYPLDYPQDYVYVTGLERLRARPRAVPRPRLRALPAGEPAEARARAAGHVRSDPAALRGDVPARATLRYNCRAHRRSRKRRTACARRCATPPPARPRPSTADYHGRHRRRRQHRCASTLGIAMSGNPALTYTTNVMFRCTDFTALHDKGTGLPLHLHRARRAPGSPSSRSTAATASACRSSAPPQKINHTEDDIRAALTRAMGRDVRLRNPVGDALGAARAGRRPLRHRARLHRRRRRAPDVADRRLRHEHRHRRRGRSRLEARSRAARAGAAARCCAPTTPSAGRSACATSPRRAATSRRMLSTRERLPGPEIFQPGAGRTTPRARSTATGSPRSCGTNGSPTACMLGYRYDNSPIVCADGTPAPPDPSHPYTQTARPGARAPHVWLARRPLDARPVRPRLRAAAPRAGRARCREHAARGSAAPACRST